MSELNLGREVETGRRRRLPTGELATHMHLVGATGTGKSTALLRIMRELLLAPQKCGLFLIDPMGNLSRDLLNFISHPTMCSQNVRDRLVYIEPARSGIVAPLNPLSHTDESNRYYQVTRAIDIVLRAWDAQDLATQPRLAQWTFNAFYSAAAIGIPISLCRFLVTPGSPEHSAILDRIPGQYRHDWAEALRNSNEASRLLESTRNRLRPFFTSPNLMRMFGSNTSRLNCQQFIRERKIVILNLGNHARVTGGALAARDGDTIGGLILNEIIEAAHAVSLTEGRNAVDPTYVIMDEFQNFVSPDIERAIPTVRQLGLRLLLAHQSFHQLTRGEVDLSSMIWQARSRLVFANNALDADIVAEQLAKLTYDDTMIKEIRMTARQRIAGHRAIWLQSETNSNSHASSRGSSTGYSESDSANRSDDPDVEFGSHGSNYGVSGSESSTETDVIGYSQGRHQAMQPIIEDFEEVASKVYLTALEWEGPLATANSQAAAWSRVSDDAEQS